MRGIPVPATGIEYHERHTITPDGRVPGRFGEPLEIPEDLYPIPRTRPTVIDARHPMAKYVKVEQRKLKDRTVESEWVLLNNCIFADAESGVAIVLTPTDGPDDFGVLQQTVLQDLLLRITYNEEAIEEENRRRLTTALRIAALYAGVIDAQQEFLAESAELKRQAEDAAAHANPQPEAQDDGN